MKKCVIMYNITRQFVVTHLEGEIQFPALPSLYYGLAGLSLSNCKYLKTQHKWQGAVYFFFTLCLDNKHYSSGYWNILCGKFNMNFILPSYILVPISFSKVNKFLVLFDWAWEVLVFVLEEVTKVSFNWEVTSLTSPDGTFHN